MLPLSQSGGADYAHPLALSQVPEPYAFNSRSVTAGTVVE